MESEYEEVAKNFKVSSSGRVADANAPLKAMKDGKMKCSKKFSAWLVTINPNLPFPPTLDDKGELIPHPEIERYQKVLLNVVLQLFQNSNELLRIIQFNHGCKKVLYRAKSDFVVETQDRFIPHCQG